MNCRNCGGAMELFATRGYFFCRYCGSFDFPDTASDQGLRVLAQLPDAPECPTGSSRRRCSMKPSRCTAARTVAAR